MKQNNCNKNISTKKVSLMKMKQLEQFKVNKF